MKVIDNSGALNYDRQNVDSTFLPAVTFAFTKSTNTIVFTEAGSVPSGDTFKKINLEVYDQNGNKKTASISSATGTASIVLSASTSLDLTGTIKILATASTVKNLAKDGGFYSLLPIADSSGALVFEK